MQTYLYYIYVDHCSACVELSIFLQCDYIYLSLFSISTALQAYIIHSSIHPSIVCCMLSISINLDQAINRFIDLLTCFTFLLFRLISFSFICHNNLSINQTSSVTCFINIIMECSIHQSINQSINHMHIINWPVETCLNSL